MRRASLLRAGGQAGPGTRLIAVEERAGAGRAAGLMAALAEIRIAGRDADRRERVRRVHVAGAAGSGRRPIMRRVQGQHGGCQGYGGKACEPLKRVREFVRRCGVHLHHGFELIQQLPGLQLCQASSCVTNGA